MFRKILVTAAMLAAFGHAYASVDVNTANEDALRGVKGIGPAKAKAILDERAGHTVERLQAEGLAVGPAGAAAGPQVAASSQTRGAAVAANTPKAGATVAVKK
jgi:competence protein ComEA